MKVRKTIQKRFKITKSGKVLRGKQYSRHKRVNKSKRRIRRFHEPVQLNRQQTKIVKSLIGK